MLISIHMRMPKKMHDGLKKLSHEKELTMSELVRRALEIYIKKEFDKIEKDEESPSKKV